jgi:hypothetical protein
MSRDYSNITLYGVQQDEVVSYLSRVNCDAYVSPTINSMTIVYSSIFEHEFPRDLSEEISELHKVIKQVAPQSFSGLIDESFFLADVRKGHGDNYAQREIQEYCETREDSLVYLSSVLSKYFSCPALAVLVKDRIDFWYHLNQNGLMIDEYTNSATFDWQPGSQRDGDSGEQIKGGDVHFLCQAFRSFSNLDQIESILGKPDNPESYRLLPFDMNYKSILNLPSALSQLEIRVIIGGIV